MDVWKCVTVGSVYPDLELWWQRDFFHCSRRGFQEHRSFQERVGWTSRSAVEITVHVHYCLAAIAPVHFQKYSVTSSACTNEGDLGSPQHS
jgi:hypothetical protein